MAKVYKVVLETGSFPEEHKEGIKKSAEAWVDTLKYVFKNIKTSYIKDSYSVIVTKKIVEDFGGLDKFKERNSLAFLATIKEVHPLNDELSKEVVNSLKYYVTNV